MKKITVYSTATCPYCLMLKRWLDEQSLQYEEVRVDENIEAAKEMVSLSGQMGVPFTTVQLEDGSMAKIRGYNLPELQAALSIVHS